MAIRRMTHIDEQIKDQTFSELQALIEESEQLLKRGASLVGSEGVDLREQVSLKLKQARNAVDGVRDRAQPIVKATQGYLGEHPGQTLGIGVAIGLGIGVIAGILLGRARH